MNAIIKVLISIFCLSLVIIIHELGHMFAAKISGITVKEFCLGFGPKIYERKIGETSFKIKLLPILGYVNISGMTENDEGDARGYNKQPIAKRIFTISAGALANFLTAIIIFTLMFTFSGNFNKPSSNVLALVSENTPANKYDLRVNDKIIKINEIKIITAEDINKIIKSSPDQELKITVERRKETIEKKVVLSNKKENGKTVGFLGVTFGSQKEPIFMAFGSSLRETAKIIKDSIVLMPSAIKKDGIKAFSSPIGITKLAAGALADGPWFFAYVMGIIAASIGFLQLIPFPGLDGGWLIFLLYEVISRKKPSTKAVNLVQATGVAILLIFILILAVKDVLLGV